MYTAKHRIHLAQDGKTLVRPGDPRSGSLLIAEGGQMSIEEAEKWGLIGPNAQVIGEKMSLDSPDAPVPVPVLDKQPKPESGPSQFPQTLVFGTPQGQVVPATIPTAPLVPPATPVEDIPPSDGLALDDDAAQQPVQTAAPADNTTEQGKGTTLPVTFPYYTILAGQGITVERIKTITRDELLDLNSIGAQRADEIIAARDALKG